MALQSLETRQCTARPTHALASKLETQRASEHVSEQGSDVTSGQTNKSRNGIIPAIEVNHPMMVEHAGAKHE